MFDQLSRLGCASDCGIVPHAITLGGVQGRIRSVVLLLVVVVDDVVDVVVLLL